MDDDLRVLMITSEWPTLEHPEWVPFLVQQVDFLRKAGVTVDVFAFRGAKRSWNYLRAHIEVQKKLAQKTYDLIHAQFGQSGLLAIFPKRYPLVVTFRGSDAEGIVDALRRYTLRGKVLQLISKLVAVRADEVIVVSEKIARHLLQRSCHIIPSGLDIDIFRPLDQIRARRELGFSQKDILVLFGGSKTVARKRFLLAQTVNNLVKVHFPALRMIVMHGVHHHKVPLYMNACDALLLVSMHEGSPNVIKEALACNLPVVSTDVGDVRERIASIDGCAVCDDDRPETIAASLTMVLSQRRRINGRQAVQGLDERILTQKVIQVYRQAIEKAKYHQ